MKRRQFLQAAGVGLAATAVAKPAIAQSAPPIKWRLTSSFPKSLETLYGAAETLSKYVAEATDNKFQIQIFAAGEVVPALAALDAVSDDKIEMCHTSGYYFVGKDPTFCHYTSIPFGMNARQQNAWFYDGDGMKLLNEFGQKFNIHALVGGNTGTQMGGWFRKEIKEPTDLKGLKFRIGGWAGKTIEKLGGVPQQIAGGDIYQALEKGTIDAAEWVGPHDDEKLGLNRVAKYYYYPAWWEGASALHFFINTSKWNALPKAYQAILTAAAGFANVEMLGRYDARNPIALRKLVNAGTELRPFTEATMNACLKAANEVNAEAAAANADFKKIYESMINFRNAEYLWWQVGEFAYDSFMIRSRSRG